VARPPRKAPPGAGKPKTPGWTVPVAVGVPLAAVLLWLFWTPLSAALGPTLVPFLGGVLPRPEGAPRAATASYTPGDGVAWTACQDLPGGAARAGWIGRSGLDGVVLGPGAHCSEAVWKGRTLTLRTRGQPLLKLAQPPGSDDRAVRTAQCQRAADEGHEAFVDLAEAAIRGRALGTGGEAALKRFTAEAASLKFARASGLEHGRLTCFLRADAPTKPGEAPQGALNATMSR